MDSITDIFSDSQDLSCAYDTRDVGWHIENHGAETIVGTIKTLSDVFVEWYLYDNTQEKDIESFLANEGLALILTPDDFMALMTGTAYLDEMLCSVIQAKLPFALSGERLQSLNDVVKKQIKYPCIPCRDMDAAVALINDIRAYEKEIKMQKQREYNQGYYSKNQEHMRQYHRDYYHKNLRQARREYYEKNMDHILERRREYYYKNKDKIKESRREYYIRTKEQQSAYKQKYYLENKDRIRENCQKYYDRNQEKIKEYNREYYRKNREKIREKHRLTDKSHYAEHKAEHMERQRRLRQRYADQKISALKMCPAFMFLSQLRTVDFQLYRTQYKVNENIVNKAWKDCAALQCGNTNLCPLVAGNVQDAVVRAQCSMPRVFEFDMAVAKIQNIVAQLKQAEK
ncbi:hypothetical protein HDR63_04095 [bacterium]|nr:hypothetical protein [bacterium]